MVQLFEEVCRFHRFCFGMLFVTAKNAGLHMACQQFNAQSVKSGPNSRNLIQDIDAVSIFFDHPLNAGNLAYDSIHAFLNPVAIFRLHTDTYTPYRYLAT